MMDDFVGEFLVESYEGLDQLDRDLVALESDPTDTALLGRVFRCVHTIKGTCGFLGFHTLESVTHVGEGLLVRLRDGELALNPDLTSALLALVDAIRQILATIARTGVEGEGDYTALVERLERLQHGEPSNAPVHVADVPATMPAPIDALEAPPESRPAVTETNLRVDVGLLDKLMTLVGELVLARNQILQHAGGLQCASLNAASQRLDLLTTELQEGVMKTRMQPIGNVWSKLPRVVRDLAVACGKQIRLDMQGNDTELDKTIIEAIKDPLTHIVRNAADHGIELPEQRVANGKPAEGCLTLRAYHEGGQVNIEIADDGAGIDPERLKQKAVEKGLVAAEHAARMGEREALNLIFLPGFSTAAAVTNISGRGVGMDVVKTNIEKIGGAVDLSSRVGRGTTLKIKIPLTLAIIPALIVTCQRDRYAIPQVNLVELVRREPRDGEHGIELIHGAPVYRLRGDLLPLVYFREALGYPVTDRGHHASPLTIVVLHADDRTFGLVVDGVNDTEEIVVKPLGQQVKGIAEFAGATIMGDGRVALILDVLGLAQRAQVVSEVREGARRESRSVAATDAQDKQTLLVCSLGANRRAAIPLSSVSRLEEFATGDVESAGPYDVVQYRGKILPLLPLSNALGAHGTLATGQKLQVVVYSERGRSVGLVVDRVLDIVEEAVTLDRATTREGLLGAAIIQQRVTDVLDMATVVHNAAPWLLDADACAEVAA